VSHKLPPYEPFTLTPEQLTEALQAYAVNPIYLDNEEWENYDNPYRRQLRPQVLKYLNFSRVCPRKEILTYESLAAQRILTTIYENDLMFLAHEANDEKWADAKLFYSPDNRAKGEVIRPSLENFAFGFLEEEVEVTGEWTKESLLQYLKSLDTNVGGGESAKAILASSNQERAAKMWLIQFAPDFLSEASPMARNVLGNYGAQQSDWFKIVLDEYGYGVHDTKHSKLFERTMESVGLRSDLHAYWQYYLVSSLLVNNWFQYLGKNHEFFFRYLGALYYTESTLVDFCRSAAETLRSVFGDTADVEYFTEHVHIDQHHGRMALEKLILPIIERCGESVIPEIVRGIEEYRVIAEIADNDFADQIRWMDAGPERKKMHDPVWAAVDSGKVTPPVAHIVEPYGELSNTHSHDGDELCHIVSGTMKFVSGFESYQILEGGEGTVIDHNRLHGAIIVSEECVYEIHSIGDYHPWLS
jgi:hypothetical protein